MLMYDGSLLGSRTQAIDIDFDGEVVGCYLTVLEKQLSAEQLRSAALTLATPIHSYMFSQAGRLLYATTNASLKHKAAGGGGVSSCPNPPVRITYRGRLSPLNEPAGRCSCHQPASSGSATLGKGGLAWMVLQNAQSMGHPLQRSQ